MKIETPDDRGDEVSISRRHLEEKKKEKQRLKTRLFRIKLVSAMTALGGILTLVITFDTLFVMQRQFRDSIIIQDSRHFESRISDVMNRLTMDITTALLYHGRPFLRDCVRPQNETAPSERVYAADLCRLVAIEVLYGDPNQANTSTEAPLLENLLGLSLELSQASQCIERGECHPIVTMASFCQSFDAYYDIFTFLDSEFLRHIRENDSIALAAISTGTLTNNLLTVRGYCRQIENGEIEEISEHGIFSYFM